MSVLFYFPAYANTPPMPRQARAHPGPGPVGRLLLAISPRWKKVRAGLKNVDVTAQVITCWVRSPGAFKRCRMPAADRD